MLIDDDKILIFDELNPILGIIANGRKSKQIKKGMYEIHHFGSTGFPGNQYQEYPTNLSIGPYGVCDYPEQIIEKCPDLENSDREFLICFTPILKSEQPPQGGWRWHKWGGYIGNEEITTEYLYDEPVVGKVYCFHIYERIRK